MVVFWPCLINIRLVACLCRRCEFIEKRKYKTTLIVLLVFLCLKLELLMVMQVQKIGIIWLAVEQRRVQYYC